MGAITLIIERREPVGQTYRLDNVDPVGVVTVPDQDLTAAERGSNRLL